MNGDFRPTNGLEIRRSASLACPNLAILANALTVAFGTFIRSEEKSAHVKTLLGSGMTEG